MKFFISKSLVSEYLHPPNDPKKVQLKEIFIALNSTLAFLDISNKIMLVNQKQIEQFPLSLPFKFSISKLNNHKGDTIKLIILNGFGGGYGDMLVGSIALENLYRFLSKNYKNVFIDFLVRSKDLAHAYEVFKLNPYVNNIYPIINLEKYTEYDFYIDNEGFLLEKDFEKLPFVDFFLKKIGLNPNEKWIDKNLKLYPNPKVIDEIKELKKDLKLTNKPSILINFFATPPRQIPEFKWTEVIDTFINNYNIILVSNSYFQNKLQKFISNLKNNKNIYNLSDISSKGFDYLIALIKEIPDVVLTPDTSLTHICGGLNKPCITVFFSISPELRITYYKSVIPYSPDFLKNSKFWKKSKLKKEEMKNIEHDKEFIRLWKKINVSEIEKLVKKAVQKNKDLKPNIPENVYISDKEFPKILVYYDLHTFENRFINVFTSLFIPENYYVKFAPLSPLEFNNLSKYDLLILGIGNVISDKHFMQPNFVDFVYGAKKTLGIFRTQFKNYDKKELFLRLISNLDYWYTIYKDDLKKYNNLQKNINYLGMWETLAFPLESWTHNKELQITENHKLNLSPDAIVDFIPKYRKVYSEQLYPLLYALHFADSIAYKEKREEGIRLILNDIFKQDLPANQYFKINKQKLITYKKEVIKNIKNVRNKIEELVS